MMHLYTLEFKQCLHAFTSREYAKSAEMAFTLFQEHKTHELIQIAIVSIRRLGATEIVGQIWDQLSVSMGEWNELLRDCLALSVGRGEVREVLERTDDDEMRCRVHYYAGAALITTGLLSEDEPSASLIRDARAAFDAAAGLDVDCLERRLAAAELEKLPYAPPEGGKPEDLLEYFRLKELASASELTTDWPRVNDVLQAAAQFAAEQFGEGHPIYWTSLSELGWALLVLQR